MSILLDCPGCGKRLIVPDNAAGRPVRCPACARTFAGPRVASSQPAEEPIGVYGLKDDSEILTVVPTDAPRGGLPRPPAAPPVPSGEICPKCDAPMTPGAVLCIHCGFNRKTRRQLRTVSRRPQDHWYKGGLSYLARLLLYFLLLLLSGGLAAVLARDFSVILALVPPGLWLVPGALLLGTTQRITVTRTAAGNPVLIRRRLIAFVPAGRTTLDLEPYTTIRPRAEPGGLDAQVVISCVLLFLLCGVPGLVYLLMRLTMSPPTQLVLEIGGDPDDYGVEQIPRQVVFRGYNEAKMRRAGDALEQIADMRYG